MENNRMLMISIVRTYGVQDYLVFYSSFFFSLVDVREKIVYLFAFRLSLFSLALRFFFSPSEEKQKTYRFGKADKHSE